MLNFFKEFIVEILMYVCGIIFLGTLYTMYTSYDRSCFSTLIRIAILFVSFIGISFFSRFI